MSSSGLLGKALKIENVSPEKKVIEDALHNGFIANKILFDFSAFFDNLQDTATEEDIDDIQAILSDALPRLTGSVNLCRRSGNTGFRAVIFTRGPLHAPLYAHITANALEKALITDFSALKVVHEGISDSAQDLESFFSGSDS